MGFRLYRYETDENLNETYSDPEKVILSGIKGPIAAYVMAIKPSVWVLNEMELVALLKTSDDTPRDAIIFEAGSDQPGHITFYRLVSIHGRCTDDTTEMVAYFKALVSNQKVNDLNAFRTRFTTGPSLNKPDVYENLKLSGGTRSGTWRWMEMEQILNATVISPVVAR